MTQGTAGDDPTVEGAVQRRALVAEHARVDLDARGAKDVQPAAGVGGVRVRRADDHPREPGAEDGVGAGRRAAVRGAGLQGNVERRAPGPRRVGQQGAQRLDFRVRLPGGVMPAAGEDLAVIWGDDHGADGRVRAGAAEASPRFAQRCAHETGVVGGGRARSVRVQRLPLAWRPTMSPSRREKQSVYRALGQYLLRAGIAPAAALDSLLATAPTGSRMHRSRRRPPGTRVRWAIGCRS